MALLNFSRGTLQQLSWLITRRTSVVSSNQVVLLSLPLIVGRGKLMCHSEDDFKENLKYGGTTFCKIQGKYIYLDV